jgi:hypothetical protein
MKKGIYAAETAQEMIKKKGWEKSKEGKMNLAGASEIAENSDCKVVEVRDGSVPCVRKTNTGYVMEIGCDKDGKINTYNFWFLYWLMVTELKEVGDEENLESTCGNMFDAKIYSRAMTMPQKEFERKLLEYSNGEGYDVESVARYFNIDYFKVLARGEDLNIWE